VDRNGVPLAHPSSSLQFRTFSDSSSLQTGPVRPIDEYETHLWALASILFDDAPPNVNEQLYRKRALSTFFKELVSRSVWNDLSRTRDPAERVFLNLTGYRLADACVEATKNKDLHLATLLALAEESPPDFRQDIHNQIDAWRKDGSLGDIQLWYRAVYELLAGEIDTRGNAFGQLGMEKRVDWRRGFAMRLWFGVPADGEIKDAVQEYWMACQQNPNLAKPLPWYTTATHQAPSGTYDGLFQLLRLYASSGVNTTLDDALKTHNFSSSATDVRMSWHLYVILSQLKGKAAFADTYGTNTTTTSDTGERLTLSYINQLEHLNLWQWAIYVSLHLCRENTRKGIIRNILSRHIATIQNKVEEQGIISQLVDQWKIPMEWILEAKV
jgi:nuclear pore complex protein Nup98-Nup96